MISNGRQRWYRMMTTLISLVNSYGDDQVTLLNTWAHMSPFADFALSSSPSVDTATGYRWVSTSDPRHPLGAARLQLAESIVAYIANVA
jgi:hypothetical protein